MTQSRFTAHPNKGYQISHWSRPSTSINLTSTCMHHSRRAYIPFIPVPRCTSQNFLLVFSSLSIQPVDLSWLPYDLLHLTHIFCRIPVVGPRSCGRKK